MLVLGIETSCDETGLALYDSERGLLAHALHTQVAMHREYGGVVPELASRDHIRRVLPLMREVAQRAGATLADIDAIAYTQGPGLAGALLVGASVASALAFSLGIPALGVHHLEGHLLSPLLASEPPAFPFVALLVSGGHTQLMRVGAVGDYTLLGETVDDAAGEAFDKTAQLLSLGYPGGPALAQLAEQGTRGRHKLPRPMLDQLHKSGNLDFSFSGLKTAVLTLVRQQNPDAAGKADIAAEFQEAIVDVLAAKSMAALESTGLERLVVAGGVGANRRLRARLDAAAAARGCRVYYPEFEFCTDNGAMIALAGALRLGATVAGGLPGASVTGALPGAALTGTLPGATLTGTLPGATLTGALPGATLAGALPVATLTGALPVATLTGALPGAAVHGHAQAPQAERPARRTVSAKDYGFTIKPRWDLSTLQTGADRAIQDLPGS